ncbi:hypothetical protein SS50377_27635 [Spironucleus salmonicida]|uniref:Uncharacterized protein n=1 Tax=Spironucleus salmonicida TaxID=348837 RepID=V6LPI1_9EUKA|nr:hypothetical protein SS50377_27635 [Spironucleus salmonicida]|eukprot:EST46587.1 Hypothetical protein SS50377_13391 [Spironucleus salmonicida]
MQNLPKPRAASPVRLIKPQSVPKPVQHRSLSPIRKTSAKPDSFSGAGVNFSSRYEYLLPKPPVVLLESAQLAQILNYTPSDRDLLQADICDFDINVEQGIPFSGSIRVERRWAQTQQLKERQINAEIYNKIKQDQIAYNYDQDFKNYEQGSKQSIMLTDINNDDQEEIKEVQDLNDILPVTQ